MKLGLERLKPESDEFLHLDTLRVIAAFGVAVFHFRAWVKSPWLAWLDGLSLFVDLFFFISGVVIAHIYWGRVGSLRGYGRFIQKRVARLLPLHLATLAFYVLLGIASILTGIAVNSTEKYRWDCIPQNILLIHAWGTCSTASFNVPSWSISAEMGVYLVTPVIFWIGARKPPALFAVAALLFAGYVFAHLRFGTPWFFDWTYDFGLLRAVPAFLMGVACYRLRDAVRLPFPAAAMWAAMGLFFAGMALHAPGIALVFCMYAVGLFALAADNAGKAGRLIRAAAPYGQLTYGVYMLHTLVATLFLSILWQKLLHLDSQMWLAAALALPISGIAAYFSLIWFERPARLWISRLGDKGRNSVPADNVALEQSAAGADLA